MDLEVNAEGAGGHRIPSDVAGLDDGRTSYLPADVLRRLNLEEGAPMGASAPGSPKPDRPMPPGSPKPDSPRPGSPKPDSPRPGSPKPDSPRPGSPKP